MALSSSDLQAYLDQSGIKGEIVHLDAPTPTVETAAQAVGASVDQIVKSVLFLIRREQPVLAVACGTARIDSRLIASYFDVGRKQVRLAGPDAVLKHTGYPAGAVPPFGHPKPLDTLLDPGVLEHREVFAGGGTGSALLRLDPGAIVRAVEPSVIPILEK